MKAPHLAEGLQCNISSDQLRCLLAFMTIRLPSAQIALFPDAPARRSHEPPALFNIILPGAREKRHWGAEERKERSHKQVDMEEAYRSQGESNGRALSWRSTEDGGPNQQAHNSLASKSSVRCFALFTTSLGIRPLSGLKSRPL